MNCPERRLDDAARVRRIRQELDSVLRAGLDAPGFAGIDDVRAYLASGRVEEAREALERLKKEQS